jgi:hypothetical protein
MLTPRGTHASIGFGHVPYVFGGSGPTAKCEKFVWGSWESLPDMHTAKSYLSCTETNGRIYIAGNGSEFLEEYNPATNRFRLIKIMIKCTSSNPSIAANGNNILVFNGNYCMKLDVRNGSVISTIDLPEHGGWYCNFSPVVENEKVYILRQFYNTLYSLSFKTSEVINHGKLG